MKAALLKRAAFTSSRILPYRRLLFIVTIWYRTLVNSYLTFLVEQGWLKFSAILFVACLFWSWSRPGKPESVGADIANGLRASILAFLVSGIFSTIMEEPTLWIVPASCMVTLAAWSLLTHVSFTRSKLASATALTALALLTLFLAGLFQSYADPLSRKFVNGSDGSTASELALKQVSNGRKTWTVVPDEKVLGHLYGKLLRQVVLETGIALRLKDSSDLSGPVDHLLLVGDASKATPTASTSSTILLCPAEIPETSAQGWLTSSPHLILLSPSMDEDSRGRFWQDCVAANKSPIITMTTLKGVGLRVDWAWEEVIKLIKSS